MAHRSYVSGMDYQYENGTGPMDSRSPFAQLSNNTQRIPPSTPNKRSQSTFDSSYRTPHTTAGASRTGSPTKPLPPVPAFNALYNTPRKMGHEMDDSSAGETPKSPDKEAYSDTGTPGDKMAWERTLPSTKSAPVVPTQSTLTGSPVKEREVAEQFKNRTGFWRGVKNALSPSPGRGEIRRPDTDRRVKKSKSRETQCQQQLVRTRRHSAASGSEADDDASELIPQRTRSPHKISTSNNAPPPPPPTEPHRPEPPPPRGPNPISAFFTFIAQHPTVPHILTFYAQLLFNIFLLAFCAYLLYSFYAAIQSDIDKKAFEASADILAEMGVCADHFRNHCDTERRAPDLETLCNNWKKCMNRDATKVARAQVSASTFAEIYNSLIEPISYKAMLFTLLLVFGCFGISNFAFGVLRNKTAEQQQQQGWGAYGYQAPPPPTPQRHFSGQDAGFYAGTPWNGAGLGLEPQPSGGFRQIEGRGSPVRKLQYN